MAATTLADALPPIGSDPLDVVDAFVSWSAEQGRPLYPHQEEAILALADGDHVVLATPTGSGKSMVAIAGMALARNRRERAVWTAPIKALVTEKFFDLAGLFGADEVGLATGDASVNRGASLVVCTAEVLANFGLGLDGREPGYGFAFLDEFHYYAEHDRGWAWQVPLLTLSSTQFVLASATLGDVAAISEDLEQRTKRKVSRVTSVNRPTPLYFSWRMTPVAESLADAIEDGIAPVYVVHSSQAEAVERAQTLTSLPLTTRKQREAIAEALRGERLNTGFGEALGRYLRNGIGVHHAGMLPRYRRLVERLAGAGLLPVICGTDTLGVGVNIPIRTVLLSSLTKFDGSRVRTLRAREFHQLAGRAGRPGFDPDGHVWAQAPEHVIDNERALARAGDDPKARRKVKRAEAPKGFVHYDEKTLDRLVTSAPEPLTSRFRVTPHLVATVLGRPTGGVEALKDLLATNHDPLERRREHRRRAIAVYRSLEAAGVAQRERDADGRCLGVRLQGADVERGGASESPLRFTSPLVPFAIELVAGFDTAEPTYALDVVSVVESLLDDPMAILIAQEKSARAAELGRLKSEGVEYEERMELLSKVAWPKPLEELLDTCFATYSSAHPWLHERPSPKSVLREMLEGGETFSSYVRRYRIERSEGLLLRYLSDAWRALDRSLPPEVSTEQLEDVVEWLGTVVRSTDASLLEEWTQLATLDGQEPVPAPPPPQLGPPRSWRTAVRTASFGWVELLARRATAILGERTGWPASSLDEVMSGYWAEYPAIETGPDARSGSFFSITDERDRWVVRQRFVDPEGDCEWGFTASVDIVAALEAGVPTLQLDSLGRFGAEVSRPDLRTRF